MTETPRAVIFDIGNVLIRWHPERVYAQMLTPDALVRFLAEVDPHAMNDRIDRGAPFRETVMAEAVRHPEWSAMIRLWHDRWLDMASPAIEDSVTILRDLRAAGVPCFALSNFGVETFALAETVYPFLAEFDRRYISGHLRMAKPDAEIYAAVEADCGLPPGSLFFTDDREDNIAAAAMRGWQVHRFTSPQALRGELVRRALLAQ